MSIRTFDQVDPPSVVFQTRTNESPLYVLPLLKSLVAMYATFPFDGLIDTPWWK